MRDGISKTGAVMVDVAVLMAWRPEDNKSSYLLYVIYVQTKNTHFREMVLSIKATLPFCRLWSWVVEDAALPPQSAGAIQIVLIKADGTVMQSE